MLAVAASGPIANFLLAIAIFTAIFTFFGEADGTAAKVDVVNPGSAAEKAGFKSGDTVIAHRRHEDRKLRGKCSASSARARVSPCASRSNATNRGMELTATPELKEITDNFGNKVRLGLLGIQRSASPDDWFRAAPRSNPPPSAWQWEERHFVISRLLGFIDDVIVGREAADQLGGPIRIAQVSGQVAWAWFRRFSF